MLSPFFFAIATHPNLVKMLNLLDLLSHWGTINISGTCTAHDPFLFLKAQPNNIVKPMEVCKVFALTLLCISMWLFDKLKEIW